MALQRYINQEQIQDLHDPVYGQLFTNEDLKILKNNDYIPNSPDILKNQISELHIYSFYGDYIAGDHNASNILRDEYTNSFLLNIRETFKEADITRGSYVIAINLFQEVWGSFTNPVAIVDEISADRTEIKFRLFDKSNTNDFNNQFKGKVQELSDNNILNNLVVNFGFNRIQKVVKVKYDINDPTVFYVKLYQPIFDEISEKDICWFGLEVVDPYIDTILLTSPIDPGKTNAIRGPNFLLDTDQYTSNATSFKNWDDALDANLDTQQRLIDTIISSSGIARLNIDYTDFNNHIFYSSAEERLRNFHYKMGQIETYSASIVTLLDSTASNTSFVSSSVTVNRNRINEVTDNFDPFERWLYYQPTASIFTHGISGSLTPWPKRLVNGKYENYSVSASIVSTWYNAAIASASAYDEDNHNRLYWAIPEHIIMDNGNSNFVTFVDMVGQHFDVLYSYIKAMPQINERDEHPERGPSRDILWHIAKSFGWQLQNTRQLGDLWNYKLGTDAAGSYENTGSLFSISQEDQTFGIWRRTINNLPYLFKTKGTDRSVKALLSIYGIPNTLLSIKEYGGPTIGADEPSWIEDRFYYGANFTGSNYIQLPRRPIPPSSGSWGGIQRVPDSIEFRFKTNYSASLDMSLMGIINGISYASGLYNDDFNLQIRPVSSSFPYSSSYSGSTDYGYLQLDAVGWNEDFTLELGLTATSSLLPLYDNDWWNVRVWFDVVPTGSNENAAVSCSIQKVADCNGKIIFSSSFHLDPGLSLTLNRAWGEVTAFIADPSYIVLGGSTASFGDAGEGSPDRFVGQITGYKEYFEALSGSTFDTHTLDPASYVANTPTGSYYTLFRYFPLGIDQQRWDHSEYTEVSSSHPNRIASFDTTASFYNWTGSQSDQYISGREQFYMVPPSLGGNTNRSKKVRIEENSLLNTLSPTARSERSQYDLKSLDTNRLAIVFAPADHTNRDIVNHMGGVRLDDYIGDPEYEFDTEYAELKRFRGEYWKKYQQRPDINAFIRILAIYDYTFFEQIKQVIPAKADLIDGILIEDNVLHRNKVKLTKKPTVSEPFYDNRIQLFANTQSGEYLTYETTASVKPVVEVGYSYVTGSIEDPLNFEIGYNYITGSLRDTFALCVSASSHLEKAHQRTGLCGTASMYDPYSGSQSLTQSYVDKMREDCCYKKVIFHYSASGTFPNRYQKQWMTAVSKSYGMHYSRSLECWYYQINECSAYNRSRFVGSKLEGPDINVDSTNTIDGGPVVTIREANPNQLVVFPDPGRGNLKVE